jgi:scyllo-inositol 2-dehydrogenase (NADP+)
MNSPVIKTALLSYGMSGEVFHAPLISVLAGFELSAIVQRSANRAASHFPSARIYTTIDEVFKDDDIDLVVVNTPNVTHFDFASRALETGKHVVVEKPFTVTTREADLLIEKSEKYKRLLTVFHNRRLDTDFRTARKVLNEGRLGKIVEFESHYDRFRNFIEVNTWKEESGPGTGILYNLGSHMLDQVIQLFGLPDYVDARIGTQRPSGRIDDFYDIRLEYPQHLAIVKSSYLVKEAGPRYIIHGVNGSFVKYGADPQEQDLKDKKNVLDEFWGREPEDGWGKINVLENNQSVEEKIPSEVGDYLSFYRNVYDVITKGATPFVKAREARDVIRLIEACYESSKRKCAIKIGGSKS